MKVIQILVYALFILRISALFCAVCENSVKGVSTVVKTLIPNSWVIEAIEIMCMNKFDNQKLCKVVGNQIGPLGKENLIKNYLNPHKICSRVCGGLYTRYYPHNQSNRILEGGKGDQVNLSKFVTQTEITVPASESLNILHLSDVHLDLNYTQTASVTCDDPICCHSEHGFPENPHSQAGPYGNKKCDCPMKLFDSLLGFLETKTPIDIVVATGDYSAHNQWEKSPQTIKNIDSLIEEKIMKAVNPKVLIQSAGNNDYVPDHQYDSRKDPQLMKVVKVKSQGSQTLTFISLNTLAYDDMNLFLFGDQSFSIFQLMSLEQELEKAEHVILMGHEPPTLRGAAEQFQVVYRALIAHYSKKIKGQFFGHTHMDMLLVNTYPGYPEVATGFGFVSPSVSPFGVDQSRTRIYTMSTSSQTGVGVIDYLQYKNKNIYSTISEWIIDYSFRDHYHLPSQNAPITLEQILEIKKKIFSDESAQQEYLKVTGMPSERTEKMHCQMEDDLGMRKKCAGKNLSTQLFTLIDMLRGAWGYDRSHLK